MANSNSTERSARVSKSVSSRILDTVDAFLADPSSAEVAIATGGSTLPAGVLQNVATVEPQKSYRDGVLIQLAFGLERGDGFDHTRRAEGARSAAGSVGAGLNARHIPAVRDAYQNIGKNSP